MAPVYEHDIHVIINKQWTLSPLIHLDKYGGDGMAWYIGLSM